MAKTKELPQVEELAYRRSGQTEVFLKWLRVADVIFIALKDDNEELDRAFLVPSDKGLDAFEHPFAYLPEMDDQYGLEALPAELR